MIDELSQCDVLDLESIPQLVNSHISILAHVFVLGTCDRLAEAEEWQRKVNEAVLVFLDVVIAVEDLVELKNDQSGDKSGSGCDGGDDLSGDELGLMSICEFDLVVLSSQIACCSDEINVMVGIVVLLEFDRLKFESGQCLRLGKLVLDLLEFAFIAEVRGIRIWILWLLDHYFAFREDISYRLTIISLNLHRRAWREIRDDHVLQDFVYGRRV